MNDDLIIKNVIITNLERRGNGKDDAIRRIEQWWDAKTGELLLEYDPVTQIAIKFPRYT